MTDYELSFVVCYLLFYYSTVTVKTFRADGRQNVHQTACTHLLLPFILNSSLIFFCHNWINQINTNLKCNPKPKGSSFLLLQLSPNVLKTGLREMDKKYMKPRKTSLKQEWLTTYKVYVID